MTNRRPIQQAHERALVRDFLNWLNSRRSTQYVVISEPNPPEAIIRSVRVTRWVEVTDVFWTDDYARDLYSYATLGETYKPVGRGPYQDMDDQFARNFVKVLHRKLTNKSYKPFFDQYGRGYLVLCMQHIWFDGNTIQVMKEYWDKTKKQDLGYFKEAYITFSSLNHRYFRRWQLSTNKEIYGK